MIPQLQPTNGMSDREQAARNAFKLIYTGSKMNVCWFNYNHAIWQKTQKAGLVQSFPVYPAKSTKSAKFDILLYTCSHYVFGVL